MSKHIRGKNLAPSRRPHRSQSYQYLFAESPTSSDWLNSVPQDSSAVYSDIYRQLHHKALQVMFKLLFKGLPPVQLEIVKAWLKFPEATQCELARIVKRSQSTIAKAMIGNDTYVNGEHLARYGGFVKNVPRIVLSSRAYRRAIVNLLIQLEVEDENACDIGVNLVTLTRSFFPKREDFYAWLQKDKLFCSHMGIKTD